MIKHILAEYELDPSYRGLSVTAEDMEYMFPVSRAYDDNHLPDRPAPPLRQQEDFVMNFYTDIVVNEKRFGVTFTVKDDISPANYMGWPSVTISGQYENVFACIATLWGGNEDRHSMADYVGMLIGDKDATTRWNRTS